MINHNFVVVEERMVILLFAGSYMAQQTIPSKTGGATIRYGARYRVLKNSFHAHTSSISPWAVIVSLMGVQSRSQLYILWIFGENFRLEIALSWGWLRRFGSCVRIQYIYIYIHIFLDTLDHNQEVYHKVKHAKIQ